MHYIYKVVCTNKLPIPFTPIVEQAAKFLSDKLVNAGSPVIGGKITVRTEAWNSQDGVTNKSEKTETWGGSHFFSFKLFIAYSSVTFPELTI